MIGGAQEFQELLKSLMIMSIQFVFCVLAFGGTIISFVDTAIAS